MGGWGEARWVAVCRPRRDADRAGPQDSLGGSPVWSPPQVLKPHQWSLLAEASCLYPGEQFSNPPSPDGGAQAAPEGKQWSQALPASLQWPQEIGTVTSPHLWKSKLKLAEVANVGGGTRVTRGQAQLGPKPRVPGPPGAPQSPNSNGQTQPCLAACASIHSPQLREAAGRNRAPHSQAYPDSLCRGQQLQQQPGAGGRCPGATPARPRGRHGRLQGPLCQQCCLVPRQARSGREVYRASSQAGGRGCGTLKQCLPKGRSGDVMRGFRYLWVCWKQAPADKRFLTLDPQQRSGAVGITLLAGVHGTRPPWRGLGGTLLPARQASGASEASPPGCRSMCRPPLDPIGRGSASRTRAWRRRIRAGRSRSRGACGAGAGLG